MSGDRVQFNYAAGQATAELLQQTANRLTQQIDDLLTSLGPIKADWYQSGSAAAGAAQQLENQLHTSLSDVVTLVGAFSSAVTENTSVAQQTDNSIASALFS